MEPTGLHPRPPCLSTLWASRSPALLSTPRVGTSDWSSLLFLISTAGRLTLCAAAYRVSLCISEMLFSSQRAWVLQLNSFAFHSYFSKLDCKSQIWKTKIKQFLFHNNPTIFKVMSVSAELGKGDIQDMSALPHSNILSPDISQCSRQSFWTGRKPRLRWQPSDFHLFRSRTCSNTKLFHPIHKGTREPGLTGIEPFSLLSSESSKQYISVRYYFKSFSEIMSRHLLEVIMTYRLYMYFSLN